MGMADLFVMVVVSHVDVRLMGRTLKILFWARAPL